MWVFDSEALQNFVNQLSRGFQRSPLEVALFFVVLIALVGVPLFLSRVSVRRSRARARVEALGRFEAAAAARGLTPEEVEAVSAMAMRFSRDPARWISVLTRAAAFNTAAARSGVDAALLGRLRMKLGLHEAGPRASFHSTVELEPGAPVVVVDGEASIAGLVTAVTAEHFEARISRPIDSRRVTVRVPRPTGIYDTEVPVLAVEGGVARLGHGEVGSHAQNRRFVRRKVRWAAVVKTAAGSGGPVRLVDLSGGGARVQGSAEGIRAGDAVTLSLGQPDGWHATLASRVVRTHDDGFSLVFDDVLDPARDELIRRLR